MTTHSAPPGGSDSAGIWQGYRHTWEYNHRLNRFGSYVRRARVTSKSGAPGPVVVGHTAASGTGNDTAHFTEFVTEIRAAKGVAFQSGCATATAECQRGDLTPFIIRVDDLPLAPELRQRDTYTVILNGFDICALEHSEKIMTLDLEVTDPQITAGGTHARFRILGDLRFDCRSPECQLLPLRVEVEKLGEATPRDAGNAADDSFPPEPVIPDLRPKRGLDRRRVDKVARWLKRQIAQMTDVDEIKRSMVGDEGDTRRRRLFRMMGRRFFLRFLKWRFSAPYMIQVHYLIIAADKDALKITETGDFERSYAWDLTHEIHHETTGMLPIMTEGESADVEASVTTLAFRRLFLDVRIDETQGSDDPVQWGKGMHMLAWHTAIRDVVATSGGAEATLDLFYQNWSEAMNEVITLTTWGAVRAAGYARIGARLALLQFREAEGGQQQALPGRIYWRGAGRSAVRDAEARFERALAVPAREAETL